MHRGHDHDHSNGAGGSSVSTPVGIGHNHATPPRRPVQWQTPHRNDATADTETQPAGVDLDLVEAAFVEGFLAAGDTTSFLRLAQVPFEAVAPDGAKLVLLRVEIDAIADVGSVTPHLGGGSFRYDPLPARMVSRRKRLRFVYFDGEALRPLDLAAATTLART
jgi:hypothetical protein